MSETKIEKLAHILDQALLDAKEIERLTEAYPNLSLQEAYQIQDQLIGLRQARGEKVVGLKMGLTSQAKREQMGLSAPVYGVLTDRMQIQNHGQFSLQGRIHPKAEPEIAFFIDRDLKGKISIEEAFEACSRICVAVEILDSRYKGFKYFSLPDVVADNSSSSHFVLGTPFQNPIPMYGSFKELENLEIVFELNGKTVATALASAISGNPVLSIVQLCELLEQRGLFLKAGSIVLAGAATQAIPVEPGSQVRAAVQGLGEALFSVAS